MKIDRSKLKRSSSELPADCKALIDKLKSCNQSQLLEELRQFKSWTCGKCELYHWVDILDLFDEILERSCQKQAENQWTLPCDSPSMEADQRELLMQVISFTALLIEHSFSRHLYSSMDHLITLLSSSDMQIVLSVLGLLFVFSKRSNFIGKLSIEKRQELLTRLSYLAESWGGKENGFGLAECCQDLARSEYPASATTLHFDNIHIEDVDMIKDEPLAKTMERLVSSLNVPVEKQVELFSRLRLTHYFSNPVMRMQCVQARIMAIAIIIYSTPASSDDIGSKLLYNGFIEELVELLQMEGNRYSEVKAAALKTLKAIMHRDRHSRISQINETSESTSDQALLPDIVRSYIQSPTNIESDHDQSEPHCSSDGEDEDLEEGELKDDDDDDDDEVDQDGNHGGNRSPESKSSSSSSSVSSVSSSSSTSSRETSPVPENNKFSRPPSNRYSSDDRYRSMRDRERQDPSQKAAKLISMRTALLEARSREIERKFQKTKTKISNTTTTQEPLTLITTPLTASVLKMTTAKPSISYSENPNPPRALSVSRDKSQDSVSESKSKRETKEKRSKRKRTKSKSKKSSSPKKRKKHKTEKSSKKAPTEDPKPTSQDSQLPYDQIDHQGPKTPPDNHVTTLNDEQIEWPSHLIRMTVSQPPISYSVNPASIIETSQQTDKTGSCNKRRKSSASVSSLSSVRVSTPPQSLSINSDFDWYYNYFVDSFEMNHNQAQHQAFTAMISTSLYDAVILEKWLNQKGFSKQPTPSNEKTDETSPSVKIVTTRLTRNQVNRDIDDSSSLTLRPLGHKVTTLKAEKEIVLPNGQVLPAGTLQKIVHPYPKPDMETLHSYYDMHMQ